MVHIDFCGEIYEAEPGTPLTVGRNADLTVDEDNRFLHRVFLTLDHQDDLWWLSNVGAQLTATVTDESGTVQVWLAPGSRIPVVFERTTVLFTAGSSTYDFVIVNEDANYAAAPVVENHDGQLTVGPMELTPEQRLLLLALCEDILRRRRTGAGAIPASAAAAERLGWTVTKFNRKLDVVCEHLSDLGVRGLRGGVQGVASSRKARLVEYAVSARLVTEEDLALLP